ncbi:MAG: DUF4160 domain-containing protein [Actinobacteria bacterium]|nr:DUF4160 domain-containing protein [Actinomycetota bacterium]
MPEISRFLGIIIYMYYREHSPAHFHAEYGGYTVIVEIESGVVQGKFPRRALSAVLEWYTVHKDELMNNWELALIRKPLNKIEPLE